MKKILKRVLPLFLALSVFCNCNSMVYVSAATLYPSSITLDQTAFKLTILDGITQSQTLHVNYNPSDVVDNGIIWSTSDASVARVDSYGTVTAVNSGTATITATSYNNLKSTCEVTVVSYRTGCLDDRIVYATGMSLNQTEYKMYIGGRPQSYTLKPSFSPQGAMADRVEWSSSDSAVASVDECGIVTAVSSGSAIITAKSTRSNISASCTILVEAHYLGGIPEVFPAGITLNKTRHTINIADRFILKTTFEPGNVTLKSLGWSSSNPSVATVDGSGKVTGISKGTTIITVETVNSLKAKCVVTVNGIYAKKIVLKKSSITLKKGKSYRMKTELVADRKVTEGKLKWTSSNKKVAKVSSKGVIKALKSGKATISVKTINGKTAKCKLKVVK